MIRREIQEKMTTKTLYVYMFINITFDHLYLIYVLKQYQDR